MLLRSDGAAVAFGANGSGHCDVPALAAGMRYTEVAAGGARTVLLRSDGAAVAFGYNGDGQCDVPGLAAGMRYTEVAAGGGHTVLLRSDGAAVAFGYGGMEQCDVPALPAGMRYTTEAELFMLWERVAWIVRNSGEPALIRAASAFTEDGLRKSIFRFFLADSD